MSIFRSIVFSSIIAGVVVGTLVTLANYVGTVPLILRSEVYEQQAAAGEPPVATAEHSHDAATLAHGHEEETWAPQDGFERNVFTAGANILVAIGFALLLSGAYVVSGRNVTWREGLFWGLGGFAVFTIAPGLGLSPELPGMPAAELGPRQVWWIGTTIATACGLGLIVFLRSIGAAIAGVALIAAPHIIGAPVPVESASPVPESLWHEFVVAVTVTSFLFWAGLGGITGALHQRFSRG